MDWNLDKDRPICPQIAEQLCVRSANGELHPHDRLPSVRDIAVSAGVNPNTVQRALESLELQGIIYSVRGSGSFVAEDTARAQTAVDALLKEKTAAYFAQMRALGIAPEQVKHYVEEWHYE